MANVIRFRHFTAIKVAFIIQLLTLWPHSKWRHECYHDNYIILESVLKTIYVENNQTAFLETLAIDMRLQLLALHLQLRFYY